LPLPAYGFEIASVFRLVFPVGPPIPHEHHTNMIKAAVALSTHPDAARAALEAGARIADQLDGRSPDWCIAFATYDHAPQLATLQEALAGAVGTPYVVGCSAAGIFAAGQELEQGTGLGVLAVTSDQMRGTPFMFRDEGDQGLTAGLRIGQRMQSSRDTDDMLLVWPDPYHVRPDHLLKSIDAVLGNVPVVGGAASARPAGNGATFQFCGGESHANAVSGMRLTGSFRHRLGVTQGCRPLGDPLRVTEAHENLILELEGRPALEVLRERAPAGLLDDTEWAFHFLFVGLLPDNRGNYAPGEYVVRNIVAADPDAGVLGISDCVEEGQDILFVHREPNAARNDLERVLDQVRPEQSGEDYKFGLYFNCLARGKSLYGQDGIDVAMINKAFPDLPILGFFCNAEIGPLRGMNQLFTYSGVMALFGE
jgi:small ligand-binding sensory domain FIST